MKKPAPKESAPQKISKPKEEKIEVKFYYITSTSLLEPNALKTAHWIFNSFRVKNLIQIQL